MFKDYLIKKIKAVMTGKGGAFEFLLLIVSRVYGSVVKLRETFYKKGIFNSKKLPCKVISIGNITVGGTGKTPMTIKVAQLIQSFGYKVVVISRGYRGSAEKTGAIVSDGQTIYLSPETAGDEPFMIASTLKDIPVIVGQDRFKAGMTAIRKFKPDVIVLDDAFQHLKLKRDVDIVLLDFKQPFGNTHLLPRGVLREPVSSLSRGDAFILTRSNDADSSPFYQKEYLIEGKPVFKSFHKPYIHKILKRKNQPSKYDDFEFLKAKKVFVFSGLSSNKSFLRSVKGFGCNVTGFLEFPDHHWYSDKDFKTISLMAQKTGADLLITTEKDYVKIAHKVISWDIDLVIIGIKISFGKQEIAFNDFIKNKSKKGF